MAGAIARWLVARGREPRTILLQLGLVAGQGTLQRFHLYQQAPPAVGQRTSVQQRLRAFLRRPVLADDGVANPEQRRVDFLDLGAAVDDAARGIPDPRLELPQGAAGKVGIRVRQLITAGQWYAIPVLSDTMTRLLPPLSAALLRRAITASEGRPSATMRSAT